jgi:alpha-L-fucosidase 2
MLIFVLEVFCHAKAESSVSDHNLVFSRLPSTWDEAIPLGNGMLGTLVWQSDNNLRFSLDRIDLWDLRPMKNLDKPEFSFNWVQQQVKSNNYKVVQEMFDSPYDQEPAPSKIPGAALEFDIHDLGEVSQVKLTLHNALCEVVWKNGATLTTYIHASQPVGWFRFEGVPQNMVPVLIPPQYQKEGESGVENSVTGQDLQRLGYEQGKVVGGPGKLIYRQKGWNGFEYEVAVAWKYTGKTLSGVWTITSSFSEKEGQKPAGELVPEQLKKATSGEAYRSHAGWWRDFWSKSSISIPDTVLEKQWYMEQYKFGSAARPDVPPISLQAVWTADNGKLPPWKGDFHHDLNTQLSYWPAYSSNHLDLEEGFLNWLWKNRETFKKYTKTYFGTPGLNVPGVTTLTGEPMGGWIQYSFGPTVGCWLARHFYLHWKYTKDEKFLREKTYPWLKDVAAYLDAISVKDDNGMRRLPLSSSPEIYDNSIKAWFTEITNFDLALIRWTYGKTSELAFELGLEEEAKHYKQVLSEWPEPVVDLKSGLMFAPGFPYNESHRHFSHLMAFHPLGLVDFSNGKADKEIITNTLRNLEAKGSDWWTGFSFSWLGNLYARAFEGDNAAKTLRTFAQCFCLKNSFHVNGDQCESGHSKYTYRPFTLEGNFAFAAGIQEMLIQSHTGIIRVFPAIPSNWEDVAFTTLRAEGAFLVSAEQKGDRVQKVKIISEKGGICRLKNPFGKNPFRVNYNWHGSIKTDGEILTIEFPLNGKIELSKQ